MANMYVYGYYKRDAANPIDHFRKWIKKAMGYQMNYPTRTSKDNFENAMPNNSASSGEKSHGNSDHVNT